MDGRMGLAEGVFPNVLQTRLSIVVNLVKDRAIDFPLESQETKSAPSKLRNKEF
jgi:hypothetical protein